MGNPYIRSKEWVIDCDCGDVFVTYNIIAPYPISEWKAIPFTFNCLIHDHGNDVAERATFEATPSDPDFTRS